MPSISPATARACSSTTRGATRSGSASRSIVDGILPAPATRIADSRAAGSRRRPADTLGRRRRSIESGRGGSNREVRHDVRIPVGPAHQPVGLRVVPEALGLPVHLQPGLRGSPDPGRPRALQGGRRNGRCISAKMGIAVDRRPLLLLRGGMADSKVDVPRWQTGGE